MGTAKSRGGYDAMGNDDNIEILAQGKFLELVRQGRWEFVRRLNATGAVIIVALTDERRLIFVEQFRVPLGRRTVEFPAGMVGDDAGFENETLAEGATRELLEETGYEALTMTELTVGPNSSGLTNETATIFRAGGLKKVADGGGVDSEDITVHEIPLEEVDSWLRKKEADDCMISPRIYAGLYFIGRDG
jgi:ADP-ribose pyrophosphatase